MNVIEDARTWILVVATACIITSYLLQRHMIKTNNPYRKMGFIEINKEFVRVLRKTLREVRK